jgi:TRAP-type mannitol/chloroaromatic compound transport system permease large subunit
VFGSLPFVAIILSMVLILAIFPGLATWLPSFL